MKFQFSLRGQTYETRPFGLFSIAPLIVGFQGTPDVATVTLRGQPIPVRPLTPEQATELADLFGNNSQDAIYAAMHQEETCSMLARLIYTQSEMPQDWTFWESPENWYTDLDVDEISQFIEVFLRPYQSIAEKIVDTKSVATLRRIIPNLPDDLTVTEIGELIALLATEAQKSEAPPPPPPVPERMISQPPTPLYQANRPQLSGVQVKAVSPIVVPSVAHLQVPPDEEDMGL